MTTAFDAVVVGAGPNGLVAANRAGRRRLVGARPGGAPEVGGAVHSDDDVHRASCTTRSAPSIPWPRRRRRSALGLERHGLVWRHAPGGPRRHRARRPAWALLHRDPRTTAAGLDAARCPATATAGSSCCALVGPIGRRRDRGAPRPVPTRAGGGCGCSPRPVGTAVELVRTLLVPSPPSPRRFARPAIGLLIAGNAGHADIPLDAAGSGLMGLLLTHAGPEDRLPGTRGWRRRPGRGARATRARTAGAERAWRCRVGADHGGRAGGLGRWCSPTARGSRSAAPCWPTSPRPSLYGGLVPWDDLPARVRRRMRRFEWDPATVKVDWALDGPIPWAAAAGRAPGHRAHRGLASTTPCSPVAQIAAGLVPGRPAPRCSGR